MPLPIPFHRMTLTAAFCLAGGAAAACAQYDDAVAAVEADDAATVKALYADIAVSADCDDALRKWLATYLARDSFLKAMKDASPARKREALQTALGYEKHWRSYAELGRLEWDEKKYGSAAVNFQLAINELVEGDPSHAADTSEIAEVYHLASASLALADGAVDMPRTRSGDVGGVFTTNIRGFSVSEVELPITFRFGTTDFDERGSEYAGMLSEHLLAIGAQHVKLGGNTDPVGTEEFNQSLSVARAEALGDYLRQHGFSGEIETEGYGESRIPPPPPGVEEGSDEHYRIARRVTFSTE